MHTHNCFTALWFFSGTTRVSQKKHPPTHVHHGHHHPLSASSIYYDTQHPLCSIYLPDSLSPQYLCKFSMVYLFTWHHPIYTPYISSPNHCLLFIAHAHTCSTKIMSSKPSLSLNSLLGTVFCSLTPCHNIHLTISISARWSAISFSFLKGQVSLPCNILLCTQLLYNLHLTIIDICVVVSNGTNCLNLFHPIQILVSSTASGAKWR